MPFAPTRNRALVLLDEQESKIAGTFLDLEIPDLCKEQPRTGTVVEVGPEVTYCSRGDRVVFGKFNGYLAPDHVCEEYGGVCYVMDGPGEFRPHASSKVTVMTGDIYGVVE